LGFGVWGFGVLGFGCKLWGLWFRILGLRLREFGVSI
jgi:hypothetical protein